MSLVNLTQSDIISGTLIVDEPDDMLKAWSHSRRVTFEKCKRWAKLAYVDKIPEPPRPLPPGKTEHANDRGNRVHEAAELFVRGGVELLPELSKFSQEFHKLRDLFVQGKVSLEGEWAVDASWNPTHWKSSNVWARIKLDALVMYTPKHAAVIDYKTGKLWGNEVKHAEQGQVYQLATFMRYPELEEVTVEFWYTDLDELTQVHYTKDQGLRFMRSITDRGNAVINEVEFAPNPNVFSCKWCPYGPKGTGHCEVGVQ